MDSKQRDEGRTEEKLQEIQIDKLEKVTGGWWDGGWGGGYDSWSYMPGGGWGGGWGSGWCW